MNNQIAAVAAVIAIALAIPILHRIYHRYKILGPLGDAKKGLASISEKRLGELKEGEFINAIKEDIEANASVNAKELRVASFIQWLSLTYIVYSAWTYLAMKFDAPFFGEPSIWIFPFLPVAVMTFVGAACFYAFKKVQHDTDELVIAKIESKTTTIATADSATGLVKTDV